MEMLVLNVELSGINRHLLRELRELGWEIDLLDVPIPKIVKYINMVKCFKFNRIAWREKYYETLGKNHLSFNLRSNYCRKKIKQMQTKYDVIFQFGSMFAPILGEINIPYIVYTDYTMKLASKEYPGWNPLKTKRQQNRWYSLETQLYRKAARVLTFSNRTRDSVVDDYGADPNKVVTTGSGVNFEAIPPKARKTYDKNIILFVGIDFERKGGFTLLEAFKEVKRHIDNARLYILGPQKGAIPCSIGGVTFFGKVKDRKKVKELYEEASIFVMPSLGDPFPNVFFEAMINQLPCIGTNISGIPEQIKDGETGLLIEKEDSQDLAKKIIYLLENKEISEEMGNAGYEHVLQNFTWEKVANLVNQQLKGIVNEQSS